MNPELSRDGRIAVLEFGATARGDADANSDRDLFVLVEDGEPASIMAARQNIARDLQADATAVAAYTVSTMDRMLARGSLFLWHLKQEGVVISDPDGVLAEALSALRPYAAAAVDLERFQGVFEDVVAAFAETAILSTFECHVLFGIARNTCMILTTKGQAMAFGRRVVAQVARKLYPDLPLSSEVYGVLESGHLLYHRGAAIPWQTPSRHVAERCLNEVGALVRFAKAELL